MTARGVLPFPAIPAVPPNRGRWLKVDDVRALLQNTVSRDWVYLHVPHKVTLGKKNVGWWSDDVDRWMEDCRT